MDCSTKLRFVGRLFAIDYLYSSLRSCRAYKAVSHTDSTVIINHRVLSTRVLRIVHIYTHALQHKYVVFRCTLRKTRNIIIACAIKWRLAVYSEWTWLWSWARTASANTKNTTKIFRLGWASRKNTRTHKKLMRPTRHAPHASSPGGRSWRKCIKSFLAIYLNPSCSHSCIALRTYSLHKHRAIHHKSRAHSLYIFTKRKTCVLTYYMCMRMCLPWTCAGDTLRMLYESLN